MAPYPASNPFLDPHVAWKEHNRIPLVAKAGSGTSPRVLSPEYEQNISFPGHGNAALDQVLSSVTAPAPINSRIPLFSPSEGSPQPEYANNAMSELSHAFSDAVPPELSLPTPPMSEPSRLQLPSFDVLGLGPLGPKASLQPMDGSSFPWMDGVSEAGPMFSPELQRTNTFAHHNPFSPQARNQKPSLRRSVELITPPDEALAYPWSPMSGTQGSAFAASLSTGGPPTAPVAPHALPASTQGHSADAAGGTLVAQTEPSEESWFEAAIAAIIHSVNLRTLIGHSLRVLSHALPSPSISGHAFPNIIDKLRLYSPSNPLIWINLLHAVPGRFNLADLPTTPPSTPGLPLGGGDDYFTTKTFESAVTAMDFEEGVEPTHARQHPLAAPASINLCVVERYIPPTSSNEFANLFNLRSASLLLDRLTELVPGNGCLVFIYPTKQGGETFTKDYLGPVLDPLLRAMVVVNSLSADLSIAVGRMMAVEKLPDFDYVRHRITVLCNELNQNGILARQRLHGVRGAFNLVYADKHEVELEREVWADWWIKQEKSRIRSQVSKYFASRLGGIPNKEDLTSSNLIQQILTGVADRAPSRSPSSKIEVGVYVIQRSSP